MIYFDIWRGIDNLAKSQGLSTSGLARMAGLNPTAFNKSKRQAPDGKQRWLNMESLNKVLEVTKVNFLDFMVLCGEKETRENQVIPLIPANSPSAPFDVYGRPVGECDYLSFPDTFDKKIYAVEIEDDVLAPVYRKGDRLIISLENEFRRLDRIIIKTKKNPFIIQEFVSQSISQIFTRSILTEKEHIFKKNEIISFGRILWSGQ